MLKLVNKKFKNVILYMTFLTGIVIFLIPLRADAANYERAKVRVGWFLSPQFQEGMSDEDTKSGYCYDYLQTVANYNGWEYEYVYGGWSDLLEMLKTGEIDVMGGVSPSEERMNYILFPDYEMGTDKYSLYQHPGGTLNPSEKESFKEKKIGTVKDNHMTVYLQDWIEKKGLEPHLIYFNSIEEKDAAFAAGLIDGMVATDNNVVAGTSASMVARIGEEPFYLAITKSRTDLLDDLSFALEMMDEIEPYLLQNLRYKNFGATVSNSTFTPGELEWIESHDTLRVGYFDNYLPYSGTDSEGNPTGLMTDVFSGIVSLVGLNDKIGIEYTAYESYEDMLLALQEGAVDCVFPVSAGSAYLEKMKMDASISIVAANMNLVYKGSLNDSIYEEIAISNSNGMAREYAERSNSFKNIAYYENTLDCLNAVNEGEAPCTIINGLRMNIVTQNPQYEGLSILQLETTDDRAIGVVDGNAQLLLILNRGINFLGENYGINASYKYINDTYTTPFSYYIRKYIAWVMLGVVTIFAIVAVAVIKSTKRAQRLAKEKDEAKTTFLFNMSHDIRTPMNAIMGFTKLLEKNQDDPEKRQDYIEKIEESSEVLLSLINNVLEMSRIEKGTLELDEQAFDAVAFNDTLFTVFDEMMSEKNIEFTREVDIKNRYVFFDPIKLREVFFNLLSNAYKYTPEGGKVHMSLQEIPYDNEGFVLYETKISDTGIGIAEDYLPHIFDEFTRERNSTEAKIEGTGLGMAIVKKLLEAMDGTIEVESKKGEGTTFTITIPHKIAAEEEVEKYETVSSDQIDFKGKRILLAEDNDFNAEIAITILSEEGFEVERASNGAECVEMIKKNKAYYYDIVLMDIQMPGMNGYEATKTIRSLDDDRKSMVPIAAMTANAFEEDRRAAYRAGMNAHLSKPIEIDELMNVLARCIR